MAAARQGAARTGSDAPVAPDPTPVPAQIAKAALRRLASERLEPTPENYARAYRAEGGEPLAVAAPVTAPAGAVTHAAEAPAGAAASANEGAASTRAGDAAEAQAWAALIERAVRGVERGGRHWTAARKKESLQRVIAGSRSDARRLQQRLLQLLGSWDSDTPHEAPPLSDFDTFDGGAVAGAAVGGDHAATARLDGPRDAAAAALAVPNVAHARESGFGLSHDEPRDKPGSASFTTTDGAQQAQAWPRVAAELGATVQAALPAGEPRSREVAEQLADLQARLGHDGPAALAGEIAQACVQARRVLQHRHHLLAEVGKLCRELTDGLAELAEDESWVQGQCQVMRVTLDEGLSARGVRAVGELLGSTRLRQQELRVERGAARDALKASIRQMLEEIAALGGATGRFTDNMGRYAEAIGRADSLESLAGTVRELVAESRGVHEVVSQAQARLAQEHEQAVAMQQRVSALEDEIRRLSSEVSTDPLTQVANRRGLMQAFETECALAERTAQQAERATAQGRARASEDAASAASNQAVGLAVALIDLDNFKKLNDRLGHANGDVALRFLTQRVAQALRPRDTLARYGGEEFVVLLPDTGVAEAEQVLTRLQRTLSAELFMSDAQGQVFVTFSAGVTRWREGERLEQALERADEALYEAKKTGKNRTCKA